MKTILSNTGYFFRESLTLLRLNSLSNALSFISIGLIFFLLAMVLSGWWTSTHITKVIQNEAEINVFYDQGLKSDSVTTLIDEIKIIDGVRDVRLVKKEEAYTRMETILGQEASVLEVFSENPFNPYLEVNINLEQSDSVLQALEPLSGIEHIRNNKDILDRIRDLSKLLKLFGFLMVFAVGISTLILVSHIIRQGIYNQREQIHTLRLLGAPEGFIALPFLLEGLLLTFSGGILAVTLAALTLRQAYAQILNYLSFIPLLSPGVLVTNMVIVVMLLSAILGLFGSFIGLKLSKES